MTDSKYQIDLLVAMNEKLSEKQRVFNMIAQNSGSLYVYIDFRNGVNKELYGPWNKHIGEKLENRPFDDVFMQVLLL